MTVSWNKKVSGKISRLITSDVLFPIKVFNSIHCELKEIVDEDKKRKKSIKLHFIKETLITVGNSR